MNNKYPYISENVPDEKISYSYSLFRGADFIEDWIESRNQYIIGEVPTDFNPVETVIEGEADVATAKLFRSWLFSFDRGKGIKEELLDLLVKRFEVTKKIFGDYDENFRPKDKRDFRNAYLYILYSTVLIYAYRKKLNCNI